MLCRFAALVCPLLASLSFALPQAGPPHGHQPANYSVDLDAPPSERWRHVLDDVIGNRLGTKPFLEYYSAVLAGLKKDYPANYAFYTSHLADFEAAYEQHLPDALGEVYALADTLGAHASTEQERQVFNRGAVFLVHAHMQLMNMGEAFSGECTSVIVRRPSGHVMHFRNWDFIPIPDVLGLLSVVVDFHFSKRQQPGFRCLLCLTHIDKWTTCMKPGHFSMSLNAREYGVGVENGRHASQELAQMQAGHLPRVALLRKVMLADSYDEALSVAVTARMLTSVYIILAGPARSGSSEGRGAVLTLMGNGTSADVLPLPPAEDGWFVVQTNVDHWLNMSQAHETSHRREHTKALLEQLGQNASVDQLYAVLQNQDVFPAGNTGKDTGRVFQPFTIASARMWPAAKPEEEESSWHVDVWRPGTSAASSERVTIFA